MMTLRFRIGWVGVSACWALACGGSTDVGNSAGAAGTASTVGSGGAAGNDGGVGGRAGAGTGGSAGDDGGMCPATEPAIGSSCAPAGRNCFYGSNPCCGGAYTCGSDGKWQPIGLGCACVMDAGSDSHGNDATSDSRLSDATTDVSPDAHSDCGGTTCRGDQFCVHPSTNLCGPAPECVPRDDAGACP